MGSTEGKIKYFKDAIRIFSSDTVYIPDFYHIILHVLIIVTFISTMIYSSNKKQSDKFHIEK